MRPLTSRLTRLPAWAVPLLLGLLCLLVYNANLRTIGAGDTLPARYMPLTVLHNGTLDFDANARLVAHGYPTDLAAATDGGTNYLGAPATWLTHGRQGRLVSAYPAVTPLLVSPLYLPAALVLKRDGWQQPHIDRAAEITEKLAASLLAAIAVVLMFLVLRREDNRWALPLALVFAFGTNTWMISSQALWQHGTGELLIALALLLATTRATPPRTALLGFVCVLMAANRPPDALIAAAFGFYAIRTLKRDSVWLLAGAVLPALAVLYYNLDFIGNLFGAYGEAQNNGFFEPSLLGLPGLLVSPTRGLLIFTPFLVFVVVGLRQRLRTPTSRELALFLSIAVVAQLLVYSQADWRAGVSWGPRWLTDILPILVWMLAPAPLVLRARARGVLVATMVVAVGIQAIGAFWYTGTSDARIFANPDSMSAAWNPRNTPFVEELGHRHAPGDLRCGMKGYIDIPSPVPLGSGQARATLTPGMVMQGWGLTCGRTPGRALVLIDGRVVGATQAFFRRADLPTTQPAAWRMLADTTGLHPGKHVIQLALSVGPASALRIVREQAVTVAAPPRLDAMATRAVSRLREDQSRPGYWLTAYTSGPQYDSPTLELNTYLPSLLVDLLSPVARERGLGGRLTLARGYLAAQIEGNGLVRYHGLPDAPTIGKLGCVITPDSDDTALAWRIAGTQGDPRERRMLRKLESYRDSRGLYRTWLAPQDKYQCINPGHDPDPADLTIQAHVYLMLHQFDPPAARALCGAMKRSAGDADIWVYYEKTALVPYLRSAELRRRGCAVPLPTARLGRPVPGQEMWSGLVRRLVAAERSRPDASERQAARELLARFSRNDFAQLRSAPPLLYHNDLSASVNRYYWSEDVGYALWLRLYQATAADAR